MKAWKACTLTALLLSLLIFCTGHAEELGELDTSFGEDGKVTTSFGHFDDQAYAVALQPDGKILAAGYSSNGDDKDLAIARYNEDGSLDSSFAKEGKLKTSIGEGDEEINAIVVQDDGFIVVAGYMEVDGGRDFLLVRFTPDGNFDNSFGEGGIVHTEFGNLDDEIRAMALDSEGRIVICGYVTGTAGKLVTLARYDVDGKLDITFGDEGIVLTDIGDDALARGIDIDEDGRIVIAGSYSHPDRKEVVLLRFLDNGDFDTSFGEAGIATPADKEKISEGYGVRILENGSVMVAGFVGEGEGRDAALFGFTDAGRPDLGFGDNGVLVTSASDEDDMAMAIDAIGNVIGLSGYNTFNTKRDFLFVAVEGKANEDPGVTLNKDNSGFATETVSYDSVFDVYGHIAETNEGEETTPKSVFSTTYFGYTDDVSYGVVLQPDGKAVSVGHTVNDNVSSFAVARYITPVANVNCQGCCSSHGGVVCRNGVTMCADGSSLSSVCSNKGCTACGTDTAVKGTAVSWILTKEPTNVSRTGVYTGGTIFNNGIPITQRGVVYSTAPDPVYEAGADGVNVEGPDDTDGGGDTTGPVITFEEPQIDQEFAAGTTSVDVIVTTDEDADCRYSTTGNDHYDNMTAMTSTDSLRHEASVAVESGITDYTAFVRCRDLLGNESANQVSFKVSTTARIAYRAPVTTPSVMAGEPDIQPPAVQEPEVDSYLAISSGSPNGEIASGSSMTYIGVYTNEKAVCKFTASPGGDFDSMAETMATADNLSHIAKVDGLQDDNDYSFFVRCREFSGMAESAEYEISFSVAGPDDSYVESYRRFTRTLRDFILPNAYAQDDTDMTDTTSDTATNTPSSVFDLTAPAYSEEGFTEDGGGGGSYSSVLENLQPGTFYYVRAYALDENGKVYYGNQLGFKTADSCFVATAAFGTLVHPYVKVLRSFRDKYLVTNALGRSLVNLYYHYSPPVADYIAERPVVRGVVRIALLPVIGFGWLALNVGFTGLLLLTVMIIMPSLLVYRSYRRLEIYK